MELELKMLPIDMIKTENRWRIEPEPEDVETIAESLKFDGQAYPILVNRSDYSLIDGLTRIRAAQKIGWTEIKVQILEVEEENVNEN